MRKSSSIRQELNLRSKVILLRDASPETHTSCTRAVLVLESRELTDGSAIVRILMPSARVERRTRPFFPCIV